MTVPKRRRKKRKTKITFTQVPKLVHRPDKTRVVLNGVERHEVPVRTYVPDNGVTFKVKFRKKEK